MSNWVENTIVVSICDREEFIKEYMSFDDVSGLDVMFTGNIAIFVFDSNGDNPWYCGRGKCKYIINEIMYGRRDGRITEYADKNGVIHSSRLRASTLLSKMINDPVEYIKVKNFISYTI